jgi:hypothetical protein
VIRIHSSFHKCLTLYFLRVMKTLYPAWSGVFYRTYAHYESIQGLFYNNLHRHRLVSVNGFAVDLARLDDDFRITRFVRDPRDLIVSGYHYHRRGAEPWFRQVSPTAEYWAAINACVPADMPRGVSYAEYLQRISIEDGLIAEIEFRRHHLESLRAWADDDRIRLYRYEDILGNEAATFADLFRFHGLTRLERTAGVAIARLYAADRRSNDGHIRDPAPGQWRDVFTPRVRRHFDEHYFDTVKLLGYEG